MTSRPKLSKEESERLINVGIAFNILNGPILFDGKHGVMRTAFTDPEEARRAAVWLLNGLCEQRGLDAPYVWHLEEIEK